MSSSDAPTPVNADPSPTKLVAVTIPAVTLPLAKIVAAVPTLRPPVAVVTPVISFEAATETTTSTSQATIDSFTAATYRSAQYQIQITQGSNYHVTTLNVVHDGSQVYIMEFGTIRTGVALATFDADINSGSVRVRGTPTTSNSTVFKLSKVLTRV